MRNPYYYIFFVFVNILSAISTHSFAQCSYNIPTKIDDEKSISLKLLIKGALDNQLSSNKICKVKIKFRHASIGDLEVFLVSPSGQRVQLIGESTATSQSTSNSLWDVTFVNSFQLARPDNLIPPIWDNSSFGILQNYVGSYYPSKGGLENIDQGTVNGTWSLVVNDVSQLGEGLIENFSIEFCQPIGINCEPCTPPQLRISNTSVIACQGDDVSVTDLKFNITSGIENPLSYKTDYLVYQNNRFKGLLSNTFSSLDTGNYKMCIISAARNDIFKIDTSKFKTEIDLTEEIKLGGICAEIGNCVPVQLKPQSQTFKIDYKLCYKDKVTFHGTFIDREGIFIVKPPSTRCDSILEYNVDYIDLKATFTPSVPQLSCANRNLILSVDIPELKPATYNWYTFNGRITSDPKERFIFLNRPGKYYVEISINGCSNLDSFDITEDLSIPKISLVSNEINCSNPKAILNVVTSSNIVSTTWTSVNPFLKVGLNAETSTPGKYYCLATDNKNCTTEDSIVVKSNFQKPDLKISFNEINCKSDTAKIRLIDSSNIATVFWTGLGIPNRNMINQNILVGGSYKLSFVGFNGCQADTSFTLADQRRVLSFKISGDSILSCDKPLSNLSASTAFNLPTYLWTLPSGKIENRDTLKTQFAGLVRLSIRDTFGCKGNAQILLKLDTLRPKISIRDTVISCLFDSIQLNTIAPNPNLRYSWASNSFLSNDISPFVKRAGVYLLTITDKNGCSNSLSVNIRNSIDRPNPNFKIDTLKCNQSVATVSIIQNPTNYTYQWFKGKLIGSNTNSFVTTDTAGFISLLIKDKSNGCSNELEYYVPDIRQKPIFSFSSDTITCVKKSVNVKVTSNIIFKNYIWKGENNFMSTDSTPTINVGGKYFITAIDSFGCIFKDSISVPQKIIPSKFAIVGDSILKCSPNQSKLKLTSNEILSKIEWIQNGVLISAIDSVIYNSSDSILARVVNSYGCESEQIISIFADTLKPKITLTSKDNYIDCIKSRTLLSVSTIEPIINGQWSGVGILKQDSLEAEVDKFGLFFIKVVDASGCTDSLQVMVGDSSKFIIPLIKTSNITCDSLGEITLESNPSLKTIQWLGKDLIIDSLNVKTNTPGPVEYIMTSFGQCITKGTVNLMKDTIPPVINLAIDTINCTQSIAKIKVSTSLNADSILWLDDNSRGITFDARVSKKYRAIATGANGCKTNFEAFVPIDTVKPKGIIIGDTITCTKSKIDLLVVSSYILKSIIWTKPDLSLVNGKTIKTNTEGIHKLEMIGVNGCTTNDSIIIITDTLKPQIIMSDLTYLPCDFSSINIHFNSNVPIKKILWFGLEKPYLSTNITASVDTLNVIQLFVTANNGCQTIDTTKVVLDPTRPIFSEIHDTIKCDPSFGTLKAINISDDFSLAWMRNDTIISKDSIFLSDMPGLYKLLVLGQNKCADSISVDLKIDTLKPIVTFSNLDSFYCENKQLDLIGSVNGNSSTSNIWSSEGGGKLINTNNLSAKIESSGIYTLTSTYDYNKCSNSFSKLIQYNPISNLDFEFDTKDVVCDNVKDGEIFITSITNNFGSVTSQINSKNFRNDLKYESLKEGKYTITLKDSLGCKKSKEVTINSGRVSKLIVTPKDTLIELGDTVSLKFKLSPFGEMKNSEWLIDGKDFCTDCPDFPFAPRNSENIINLSVTDELGCTYQEQFNISLNLNPFIILPNIFKPGSQKNGTYYVPNLNAIDEVLELVIHDYWGNIVFQRRNIQAGKAEDGWNGLYNGNLVNPGVFVVYLKLKYKGGREKVFYRDVTVIR
jgi:subtilisin-like proprotein convertase family protein